VGRHAGIFCGFVRIVERLIFVLVHHVGDRPDEAEASDRDDIHGRSDRHKRDRRVLVGSELDVIAIIGIVLLIGIVKKNAIMMIDFALDAERNEGMAPRDAIHQACLLRLRPILMTTMAALLGALPLMVGGGTGSELRQPLGIAIVGGLIVSQVLTLFTTPVIYLAFDSIAQRFRGRDRRAPAKI